MPRFLATADRVGIRRIRTTDQDEFCRLATASKALHHPWLSAADTGEAFAAHLRRARRRDCEAFLIGERATGDLVGFVNINNIVHGGFRCGALGYAAFAPAAGRGLFGEGLGLVVRYAFDRLGLHRLEANIQPGNVRSLAVVGKLGFRREGFSPDFLFIDGAWRDHERWAITSDS